MTRILRLSLMLIAALLCGCNLSQAAPTAVPTATTVLSAAVASPVPTLARASATGAPDGDATGTPEPTAAPDTEGAQAAAACDLPDDEPTTLHTVEATIDYAGKTVEAHQVTRFINRGDAPLDTLVFNVEPNYWLNAFKLNSVDGADETALTGRRLTVRLSEPIEPGCAALIELDFEIDVPEVRTGIEGYRGYLGYSERQLNLGHWLPTLAVRASNAWVTRESFFAGEQTVLDVADWDVTLTLLNAEDVLIAAPGIVEDLGEGRWRGQLSGGRDYAVSLSDAFVLARGETITGLPVELYTLGDTEVQIGGNVVNGMSHALTMAVRSLELFSEKFGEYPYPRMVVVQGDFPDGMEFSGFAFVSTAWFREYTGSPEGYLTLITVHEVAHQWWYARVGSDSAMTPWLDEALSTYSELVFLEQFFPELAVWWWEFRVDRYAPEGFVDSSVYEFTTLRAYINAVYLNGVRMLDQLRDDLGEGVFFDLLKRYATTYEGQVVVSSAFWKLLTPEQLAATQRTRAQFLRRAEF